MRPLRGRPPEGHLSGTWRHGSRVSLSSEDTGLLQAALPDPVAVVAADLAVPALGVMPAEELVRHLGVLALVEQLQEGAGEGLGLAHVVRPGADRSHFVGIQWDR